MFGKRFWGRRYFGPRYWGEKGQTPPAGTGVVQMRTLQAIGGTANP